MRKLIVAAAATTALVTSVMASGFAVAGTPGSAQGIRSAVETIGDVENAQYRYQGRRHCWYARGWNGPGWYWCGYAGRRNHGWGGAEGWNGWRHR